MAVGGVEPPRRRVEDGSRVLTVKLVPSRAGVGSHGTSKVSRLSGVMKGKKKMATKAKTPATPAEVRAWANENGYSVAPRGRIAAEVLTAFTKKTKREIASKTAA